MQETTRDPSWSTGTIFTIIAIVAGLVADRVIVAQQIENNHTLIMVLQEDVRELKIRTVELEREARKLVVK